MRVAFFGTPEFAVPTLRALLDSRHEVVLVVAQPDRPVGRGLKTQSPPVALLARERGVTLIQPGKIDDEAIRRVASSGAEVAVVVAYGKILPARLIDSLPLGFLNVHASLLPKWRGAAPVQRSIEAGESSTGVTIMRIDEKLDHGPTLSAREVTVDPDERAPSVLSRLAEAGAALLIEVLEEIEEGSARETPQNHDAATFAGKIGKEESRVEWTAAARSIYDRFRAFDPWPGVAADVHGERIRLVELGGVLEKTGRPGEVLAFEEGAAIVGTGRGALVVAAMQRPGRKSAPAADVLRGMRLGPGDFLR